MQLFAIRRAPVLFPAPRDSMRDPSVSWVEDGDAPSSLGPNICWMGSFPLVKPTVRFLDLGAS